VGAGAAGQVAAETLRSRNHLGKVTLIGEEKVGPVDRPNLSKDYLAGNAPEDWIPLRPSSWYAENDVDLLLGTAVSKLDPTAKVVELADGRKLNYQALILATGAEPLRLPIPGADLPHVFTLRSLADSRAIIERAKGAKRAVVIGSSFIGLEVAASLRARNVEVHVVSPDALPLGKVLGEALGTFLKGLHESKGVVFHLGRKPASIEAAAVTLDNGERLEADLVVMGVGVRPRTQLAQAAGLSVDDGVVVDAHLQTSAPGIFACGDIARWPDPYTGKPQRVEHWVVAERQAACAALNAMGRKTRFTAAPFFWSQHYDVPVAYVGLGKGWDAVEVRGDIAGRDCTVAYKQAGKVVAVATIYRDQLSLEVEAAMERGDAPGVAQLAAR
jgi:NADPH-dependent 2,4-dienoyl-CoA reductase/sulfur reductase-like enzyme